MIDSRTATPSGARESLESVPSVGITQNFCRVVRCKKCRCGPTPLAKDQLNFPHSRVDEPGMLECISIAVSTYSFMVSLHPFFCEKTALACTRLRADGLPIADGQRCLLLVLGLYCGCIGVVLGLYWV